MTGSTATATTAFLYDGNTLVGSESIVNLAGTNSVTFDDIDFDISEDTTKTLSVRIDVENATYAASIFTADIDANDIILPLALMATKVFEAAILVRHRAP